MLTATTRICPICRTLLPDPTATTCDRCGRGLTPRHETWAPVLKWWLLQTSIAKVLEHYTWRSPQDIWEDQVRGAMLGGPLTKPNVWGLALSNSTPVTELYPLALERAGWWKQSGSPIGVRVIAPPSPRNPE